MSQPARTPPPKPRMTSDEFIAWAMTLPDGERYELVDGEIFAMSPERLSHTRTKNRVVRALEQAIARANCLCEAIADGITVQIDDHTNYEPDAIVRCGEPLDDDVIKLADPVIVVEVVSPSSRGVDTTTKLTDYFRLASVRHYLVVRTKPRMVVHHARDAAGRIQTRIVGEGALDLDPPGMTVPVAAFFA